MDSGIAYATVKISHKVLPPPPGNLGVRIGYFADQPILQKIRDVRAVFLLLLMPIVFSYRAVFELDRFGFKYIAV